MASLPKGFNEAVQQAARTYWKTLEASGAKNSASDNKQGGKRGSILAGSNVNELLAMDFVFISMDAGERKRILVESLVAAGKPFVDLGMGLWVSDSTIGGNVRTTLVTPKKSDHRHGRIGFGSADDDAYATNIQVAELNALNAIMAVIAWKRHLGFYNSSNQYHFCNFTLRTQEFLNEDDATSS